MADIAFDFDVDALIEENQADMPAREREGRRRRRIDDSDSERSVSPARSHHTHSEEDSDDASGDEDEDIPFDPLPWMKDAIAYVEEKEENGRKIKWILPKLSSPPTGCLYDP